MFHLLYSDTDEEQFEKYLYNQFNHTTINKALIPYCELPPIKTYKVMEKGMEHKREDKDRSMTYIL